MTQKQRLLTYERFMHTMSMHVVTMNQDKIRQGVMLIDSWSYAHRVGNGELGPRAQQQCVDNVVRKMESYA
jgi:hypothetical protein